MANKKINPMKKILTQRDLQKANEEWISMLKEMSATCTQNGELIARYIMMLALVNSFKFTSDDMIVLFDEYDRILNKIADTTGKHRNYSLNTVCKELKKYDIYVEEEWDSKWNKICEGKTLVEQEIGKYYSTYIVGLARD